MLVGYMRVATDSDRQVLDLQGDALITASVYERAGAALRRGEHIPDELLAHISPLGWEHVSLTGDYLWAGQWTVSENPGGLRPLRPYLT